MTQYDNQLTMPPVVLTPEEINRLIYKANHIDVEHSGAFDKCIDKPAAFDQLTEYEVVRLKLGEALIQSIQANKMPSALKIMRESNPYMDAFGVGKLWKTPLHVVMQTGKQSFIDYSTSVERRKLSADWEPVGVEMIEKLDAEHLNMQDGYGMTPLMLAIETGKTTAAIKLIEKGVRLNTQDHEGRTAAMIAAFTDNEEIMKLLIKNDADLSIKDQYGRAAFDAHYARTPKMKALENSSNSSNQGEMLLFLDRRMIRASY